jgi:hypothetical protein
MREGKEFSATGENIDINKNTLSNRFGKQSQKEYFNETT